MATTKNFDPYDSVVKRDWLKKSKGDSYSTEDLGSCESILRETGSCESCSKLASEDTVSSSF